MGFLTIVGTSTGIHAQDTNVYVDAGVSHARPPADVNVDPATYALLGGRFVAGPAFGSLYGALATDQNTADWVGGTLGGWFQSTGQGRWGWALTGIVSAFKMGDPTPYSALTARLVPEARLSAGQAAFVLRGYAGVGQSEVPGLSGDTVVDLVADLWMLGAGLEGNHPFGTVQGWAGLEAYNSAGGSYIAGYVGLIGSLRQALWGISFKLWDTPKDVEPTLNFTLQVPLGRRWSTEAAFGRSGPDPLLNSPAGVDGSVVVSWTAWSPRSGPDPVITLTDGSERAVVFRLELSEDAESVSVMGDFSAWEPVPMRRQGKAWLARVPVDPGLYHFGFLVDGEWYVPESAPGKITDDFGRTNATLVVPGQ